MKIEALFPYILPDVPGAPDITVKQALLNSAIEFCVQTHAWNEICDPVALVDGERDYDIDVPNGARVVTLKNVWAANRELIPVTMAQLQDKMPNWQDATGSQPAYFNIPGETSTVRVYPIPQLANSALLTFRAVYAPLLSAALLPDSLINRYLEPIISGAKHRLMLAPGKGWSNPPLAEFHRAQFDDGMVKAKIDVIHEKAQGSIKVRPVRFI